MLLISNNIVELGMEYPKGAIIRVNTAWVNTVEKLEETLKGLKNREVYLDYPIGRTKFPRPNMTFDELIAVVEKYRNVKYFAWSNAENSTLLKEIRTVLPNRVMLVPKIETLIGVLHLEDIISACQTKLIMIDKEDLATSAKTDEMYVQFLDKARSVAKKLKIECIELKGVIFN